MTVPSDTLSVGHGRDQASRVVMPWLVRLRWLSVLALAAAAWAAEAFWRLRLPVVPLVALLAALAATNAALTLQMRSPEPRRGIIGSVLLLDVGLLTGILYLVGGPLNPFSIVYLVGITVAAVALGLRWAIGVAIVSNLAYGLIFRYNRPFVFTDPSFSDRLLTLHLSGMWIALAAAAGLIAIFVSRVSDALELRERELAEARSAAARSERLAALFSLGAGAAHELATPLSTISTAAAELERTLTAHRAGVAPAAADYIAIIRGEIDRCTNVLDHLSGRASSASAADTDVALSSLIDDVKYRLGESLAHRLEVRLPLSAHSLAAPAEPLRQTLTALLRNAFDASTPDQVVTLRVEQHAGVRMEVIDRGRGMSPEEALRAGEPFFTTKPHGAGLGLGLFLARAFAEQMGGTLQWQSVPGEGTSVVLVLPPR